jgi:hypothetical protein
MSDRLENLENLARIMREKFEENTLDAEGKELVVAALARLFPEDVHTRERCPVAECQMGNEEGEVGCDECPTDSMFAHLDAKLTAWLNPAGQAHA